MRKEFIFWVEMIKNKNVLLEFSSSILLCWSYFSLGKKKKIIILSCSTNLSVKQLYISIYRERYIGNSLNQHFSVYFDFWAWSEYFCVRQFDTEMNLQYPKKFCTFSWAIPSRYFSPQDWIACGYFCLKKNYGAHTSFKSCNWPVLKHL